ncbi:hypothetical protein J3E07_001622 [Methanococcus voltae]|uniref:Uncharacterized protein n=1 Tax=Methanococcus voltae TaxID=2188 RepID=A0A8J7RJS1_METVO|nr:hypothetical protein [Methanococcus voltae]MBP2202181.1 hypothetical protein [Methanococcus voltae]
MPENVPKYKFNTEEQMYGMIEAIRKLNEECFHSDEQNNKRTPFKTFTKNNPTNEYNILIKYQLDKEEIKALNNTEEIKALNKKSLKNTSSNSNFPKKDDYFLIKKVLVDGIEDSKLKHCGTAYDIIIGTEHYSLDNNQKFIEELISKKEFKLPFITYINLEDKKYNTLCIDNKEYIKESEIISIIKKEIENKKEPLIISCSLNEDKDITTAITCLSNHMGYAEFLLKKEE